MAAFVEAPETVPKAWRPIKNPHFLPGAGALLRPGYGSILYSHSKAMIGGGFMC